MVRLCLKLGQDDLGRLIRPQLLRAGTGVATNHRAACRARSKKEFASRLGVVVEEADESEFWLDGLHELNYGPMIDVKRLQQEAVELRAIFGKSRATVLRQLNEAAKARRGLRA